VKNQSRLQFTTPQGTPRIEARLVNISRGGALVAGAISAPHVRAVWLRIESPVKTDWVYATIVRRDQEGQIGLRFIRGCPDDLLQAGTIGIDLALLARNGPNVSTACD
jgi:hypothetical protein